MSFVTYAGMGAALVIVCFVLIFSSIPVNEPPPERMPIPVATLETIGSTTPFYVQLEALIPEPPPVQALAPTLATATPPVVVPVVPKPALPKIPAPPPIIPPKIEVSIIPPVVTPPPAPKPVETPKPTTPPTISSEVSSTKTQNASVNIICSGNGGAIRGMSASGVIIDSRGIILTVAHAAQYYLLYDYPNPGSISCTIRTGSPARRAYIAKPIFISESWIRRNPGTLVSSAPRGTGEHDFALLAITGSATGSPLPSSFPYAPLSKGEVKKGEKVTISSYAAQELTSAQINSGLNATVVQTTIKERYSFSGTPVDLVSLGGSVAAQTGSSGGGVTNTDGAVVAMITTSTNQGPYESRNINAITPGHIRRSFANDTGKSLDSFLDSSISSLISEFTESHAPLRSTLINAISSS